MKKYIFLTLLIFVFTACQHSSQSGGDVLTFDEIISQEKEDISVGVDHSAFDALLRKYVNDIGLVNYKTWKAEDEDTVRQYVKDLGEIDPRILSREEKLAYFINAYNALTIQGMLEFYPIDSIKDKVSFVGFSLWEDYPMNVFGRDVSLAEIEHEILRKMDEPRIHFAIVCASLGCPELLAEAYTVENLEEKLEDRAFVFVSREQNFKIDKEGNIAELSSIFDWFKEDFGGSDEMVLEYIDQYLTDGDEKKFIASSPRVKYVDYHWGINEQK